MAPEEGGRGSSTGRGPKPLSEALGALFSVRGLGRLVAARELEEAWRSAVGEEASKLTRVGALRHGVLTVTVAHSALLHELAGFRKPSILETLRREATASPIHDIRFRVGAIGPEPVEPESRSAPKGRLPKSGGSGRGKRRGGNGGPV